MRARLKGTLRLILAARSGRRRPAHELDRPLFVLTNMLDALSYIAVVNRPPGLSLADAAKEAVRAVRANVNA
jgi:hypothetical protein